MDSYVVGDAVWDMLAARLAGRGCSVSAVLTGGYGDDELTRAGAFRVYPRRRRPEESPSTSSASSPDGIAGFARFFVRDGGDGDETGSHHRGRLLGR